MSVSDIIGIGILICVVAFLVIIFYAIRANLGYRKEMLRMSEYSINSQAVIDDNIPRLLNDIIDECFQDYQLMVLIPNPETHISEQREAQIRADLIAKVVERLSPMSLDKLSLRYNVSNIDRIIADKVYITVTNYVVQHNDVKENLEDVPG